VRWFSLSALVNGFWEMPQRRERRKTSSHAHALLHPGRSGRLFGWLLWGDFTMTLMEAMPSLLGMQLKDPPISNMAMTILMVTIPTVCNIVLNPVVSYSSDRYRSRWGRRRLS